MKKTISIVFLVLLGACGSNPQSEGGGTGDASFNGDVGAAGATAASTGAAGQVGAAGSAAAGTSGTAGREGKGGNGGSAGSIGNSSAAGTQTTGDMACSKPVFVTADTNGGWSDGGYYVHNNMWNSAMQMGPETMYACSYRNWGCHVQVHRFLHQL
jgi:hypothetical protein